MIVVLSPHSILAGGSRCHRGCSDAARGNGFTARGSVMLFKAMAELDDGDLSLIERTLPPGGRRPPPHRHTNCSEAYFVLDGEGSVVVDGEDLRLGPEDFVLVPSSRSRLKA